MKSSYKLLGNFIREVNNRDRDITIDRLLGVSIRKKFIPSIANIIGTDMSTYKIVKRNQFAYGPITSRNGDKISIALLGEYDEAIISQAYTSFEIKDANDLLPEYLMMWFRRPEFDRYTRFMSHGSAREIFGWDEMCNTLLPVPSLDDQIKAVNEYNLIESRIETNIKFIQKLQEATLAIYDQWFVDYEFPDEDGYPYKSNGGEMTIIENLEVEIPKGWQLKKLSDFCDVKGGKRLPKGSDLNDEMVGVPYIKVADMGENKFLTLHEDIQYVDNETQKSISRYIVSEGDIIISIVGTIGLINVIDETLSSANLTENCVKLTNFKEVNSDFIYQYLSSTNGQRIIDTKIVGGVQEKLPLYNIHSIPVILPNNQLMDRFESITSGMNSLLKNLTAQNVKLNSLKSLLLSKIATIECS